MLLQEVGAVAAASGEESLPSVEETSALSSEDDEDDVVFVGSVSEPLVATSTAVLV